MSDKVVLKRKLNEGEKIAPQQKAFYDHLLAAGVGKEVDRKSMIDAVVASGALVTRQPPDRIFAYYVPKFAETGLIEVIKAPKVAKEKAEKPAKPAKSPAEAPAKPEKG
jgi:hypothetical protein